jgi:competence ComEA-like helix-hairpin-helix protein
MSKRRGKIQLSPAWWIAYGVVIGLGAAGLILLLAAPPRGKPIDLVPGPTRSPVETEIVEVDDTATPAPTEVEIIFPININLASLEDLEHLPDIGPNTALAIINYRNSHGDFTSIEQIQNVSGIGPGTFETIKPLITVE